MHIYIYIRYIYLCIYVYRLVFPFRIPLLVCQVHFGAPLILALYLLTRLYMHTYKRTRTNTSTYTHTNLDTHIRSLFLNMHAQTFSFSRARIDGRFQCAHCIQGMRTSDVPATVVSEYQNSCSHIEMHVHLNICMCACMYVRTHIYICTYVCLFVCMHACMYV